MNWNQTSLNQPGWNQTSLNQTNQNKIISLKNVGNSCYINAILQCLINDTDILNYLKHGNGNVCKVLIGIKSGGQNVNDLKQCFTKKMFIDRQQNDAYEFMLHLFELLHAQNMTKNINEIDYNNFFNLQQLLYKPNSVLANSIKNFNEEFSKYGYSFINYLFTGQYLNTITCKNCNNKRIIYEIFNEILLDITSDDLLNCLANYLKNEDHGSDSSSSSSSMLDCDSCKQKTNSIKKINILHYPRKLVIILKRYTTNVLRSPVKIPFNLQFSNGTTKYVYKLTSVVNHCGNNLYSGGHYNTIVCGNDINTRDCILIDDDIISNNVDFNVTSNYGYMLFFSKTAT